MNFIFLGSPGVGKGTYASKIKDILEVPSISTGDMLRAAVKKGTELGIEAREYMNKGELVPDELVIGLIDERIKEPDCENGFILDGFPRTIKQAEELEKAEVKIDAVINFIAMKDTIIKRLSGRRVCKKCGAIFHIKNIRPEVEGICDKCKGDLYQRDDDKAEAISERLDVYNNQTAPLIGFYKERKLLREVQADSNDVAAIVEKTAAVMKAGPKEM